MAASFLQRTLPAMWTPKRQRTERPRPSSPPPFLLNEDEEDCLLGLLLLSRVLDHPDAVAPPPTPTPKQQSHLTLPLTEDHELSPIPSPTLKQQQDKLFPPSTPPISNPRCECGRVSSSCPAFAGHNSSRQKRPALAPSCDCAAASTDPSTAGAVAKKPHECSVCRKSFPTGQALGGHMRSHSNGGRRRRQATARNH